METNERNERIRLRLRRRGGVLVARLVVPIPADKRARRIRLRALEDRLLNVAYRLREDADAIDETINEAMHYDT